MSEPRIVLSGLGIPESPRWHQGRLWFCNWIDRQVMTVDTDGMAEVVLTRDPASHPMGYSIDWLPDGRLLTTGDKVRRQEPDGLMAVYAGQQANEIVVRPVSLYILMSSPNVKYDTKIEQISDDPAMNASTKNAG